MRKLFALLLAAGFVLLGVWIFLSDREEPPVPPGSVAAAEREAEHPTAHLATPVEPARDQPREIASERSITAVAQADAARSVPAPDSRCEIKGRFLLPGGSAAAGVPITMHGWESNNERVIAFGRPGAWEDPRATTGTDGLFSIRFDPPRAYQFTLDAKIAGHAKVSWRWGEIEPGSVVDVGDVTFVRGGTIRGHVVDKDGKVQRSDWRVSAEGASVDRAGGRDSTRASIAVDPVTGEFRIEDMPPGLVKLSAHSELANWSQGPSVEVRAGEEATADIVYTGPDNSSRIVVIPFSRPFYVFASNVTDITLRGNGIEPRKSVKIEHSSQSNSFDDLPAGSYTVEINDPRFLPWSKDGVTPGSRVKADLKGSAAVQLAVVDDASGETIVPSSILVRFDKVNFSPNTFQVVDVKNPLPASGLLDGLIPANQTLIVKCEGYADCEAPAPDLRAGEIRRLTARMSKGASISGAIVQGEFKELVAGIAVELSPKKKDEGHDGILILSGDSKRLTVRTSESDSAGRFAFTQVPAGTYTLRAAITPLLATEREVVVDAANLTNIDLVLPSSSFLSGRLLAPEGARFDGLFLIVMPDDESRGRNERRQIMRWQVEDKTRSPIQSNGAFRTVAVPAGRFLVTLHLPDITFPSGFGGSSRSSGPTIDLGAVTIAAGTEAHQDFDLRDSFPGAFQLTVTVNGARAAGVTVQARNAGDHDNTDAAALVDAEGHCRLGPLLLSEHRLLIQPVDQSWFHLSPPIGALRPAEVRALDIDVPLVEGTLQAVDQDSGTPLASKDLTIELDGLEWGPTATVQSDTNGMIRAKLPVARYRLSTGMGFRRGKQDVTAAFDWTATGAMPATIKLPKSD